MATEFNKSMKLLEKLIEMDWSVFPEDGETLSASSNRGVYLIANLDQKVLHVGSTPRGKNGIHQRLKNHLHGKSSFARQYLIPQGLNLRAGYLYCYIEVRVLPHFHRRFG